MRKGYTVTMHPLIAVLAAIVVAVIAAIYLPSPFGWIVALVVLVIAAAIIWNSAGRVGRRP